MVCFQVSAPWCNCNAVVNEVGAVLGAEFTRWIFVAEEQEIKAELVYTKIKKAVDVPAV